MDAQLIGTVCETELDLSFSESVHREELFPIRNWWLLWVLNNLNKRNWLCLIYNKVLMKHFPIRKISILLSSLTAFFWQNCIFTVFTVISPWHVAAEVIKLSTTPSPLNPFEIDLDHFHNLTPGAAVYATAAMINILSRIISPSPEKLMYASKGKCFSLSLSMKSEESTVMAKMYVLLFCC